MTAIDRVKALHLRKGAAPICDDCIALKAQLSNRQHSNEISRHLISISQLARRKDKCSSCGGVKYVMFRENDIGSLAKNSEIASHDKQAPSKHLEKTPTRAKVQNLDKLLEIGFISIGHWQNNNGSPELTQSALHTASPALYAFVENEQVLYVGKTSQTLKKRLYYYGRPGPTQTTNIRINANLKSALLQDRRIDMYGYEDVRPLKVGIFGLNLAAALEDSIIKTLSPVWNARGT